ncbi:hypothetical protein FQN54_009226 [Arachnomyces sp. PD_36]|nr:hypothetical protein FQN54_009226 [Arachnomyces sp. PD_36]
MRTLKLTLVFLLLALSQPFVSSEERLPPSNRIQPTSNGLSADRSPGIGVEFETGFITFVDGLCSADDTNALKGKQIDGRSGSDWKLTADATLEMSGRLQPEYILLGTTIKLGTGRAEAAAAELEEDLKIWNPANGDIVTIHDSRCGPWKVSMGKSGSANVLWSLQVTAPLPLEGINHLMAKMTTRGNSPIIGAKSRSAVWVEPAFFENNPGGLSMDDVSEDARGFLALVLSYAKATSGDRTNRSPKFTTSIMPRTDFAVMYNLVKGEGLDVESLWDVVNELACYRNEEDGFTSIDTRFCVDSNIKPVPNGEFENLAFRSSAGTLSIKEWVDHIQQGVDKLKDFDRHFDGQIGGLNGVTELVLGSSFEAPIFEFRDLSSSTAQDFGARVGDAEKEIVNYHDAYRRERTTKSNSKKQARWANLVAYQTPNPEFDSTTIPPLITPPITVYPAPNMPQGCYHGTLTASASNFAAKPVEMWTTDCDACTMVVRWADLVTCTSMSGCNLTQTKMTEMGAKEPALHVWLSNNSIPIGDAANKNDGGKLWMEIYQGLREKCPDNGHRCDTTTSLDINDIRAVVNGEVELVNLSFTFQNGNFTGTESRDGMLVAAISSWQQGGSKSCEEVECRYPADWTGSGCDAAPIKQNKIHLPLEEGAAVKARIPVCGDCESLRMECPCIASNCVGPDHISKLTPQFSFCV